jgi:hypothetical protein
MLRERLSKNRSRLSSTAKAKRSQELEALPAISPTLIGDAVEVFGLLLFPRFLVPFFAYLLAIFAHLARPFRKGSAPAGELTVVNVVLKGCMWL